ncbi:hypothetical protein ILUMI_20225 [Ignelater luminosus]|uniref:Sodium channel protein Nach n=1 Tax=Ignelater luminosus TaxID=2038154 RepID=A0A8K0CK51_IGNLU|nr:hypothetical protein ILUMI_20225 [Ignelater luminosus]
MDAYKTVIDGLGRAGYTIDRLMAELAHPCSRMVKKCFWQSEEVSCEDIFDSVRTSQGFCCAFNYYGTSKFMDNLDDPRKLQYQYVGGAGPNLGLRLFLDVEESQYVSSIRPSYGINVLVQDGFDYPDMDLIANTVLSTEELTISVTPRVYISTENLKYLSYAQRHCLFEDEGDLEWTSTYSYKTCITQCRVKAILEFCDCIPYHYPVKEPKRFCTLLDVPCLKSNRYKYNALEIMDNFFTTKDAQGLRKKIDKGVQCNCYPQCNELMFDFHIDRAKATPMIGFEFSNVSVVNIYYTNIGCIQTERDVYFTWDRILGNNYYVAFVPKNLPKLILASIGGLFGLCLGGSVISILECFYFFGRHLSRCKSVKPKPQYVRPASPPIYITDLQYYNHKHNLERRNYNDIQKHILSTGWRNY